MINLKPVLLTAILLCAVKITIAQHEAQTKDFVLKGKIKGQTKGMLKLSYPSADGRNVQDSTAIQNGAFEFRGKINEPVMAYFAGAIKSRGIDDPNSGSFFIEPGTLSLEVTAGDFKNLKLKGSKTQDELTALELVKAPITKTFKPISEAYQKANEIYMQARKDKKPEAELDVLKEKASAILDQFEPFNAQRNKIDLDFIKNNPNSYYAASMLRWKVSSLSLAASSKYYEALSPAIKDSNYGKEILKEIKSLQGGSPGSVASVFSTQDINGQRLSLADFKGKKYVLLDFWASWCIPCRKGNPHLLSLYSKYKDKGLEILGISDDDSAPDAWKKAVEKDQIGVWKHVLRGLKRTATGYDKSADISEPYGIHTLPTKILIDKNGKIIGRYGGGGEGDAAMDQKLAEIFN